MNCIITLIIFKYHCIRIEFGECFVIEVIFKGTEIGQRSKCHYLENNFHLVIALKNAERNGYKNYKSSRNETNNVENHEKDL